MTYFLEATAGSLLGSQFELNQRLIIGRDADVDIQVVENAISRQHAAVLCNDQGEFFVMDLASKNGTFLNGESVGRAPLQDGDVIRLGDSEFVFRQGPGLALSSEEREVQQLHLASGPAEDSTAFGQSLTEEEQAQLRALREAVNGAKED